MSVFDINEYASLADKVCMHCSTQDKADIFLDVLMSNGRRWRNGESYIDNSRWNIYDKETCYYFLEGTYGSLSFAKHTIDPRPLVLSFDDFDWTSSCISEDNETLDVFLNGFNR